MDPPDTTPQPPVARSIGITTIVNEPAEAALDIIFVHGFTGHPQRTWTHKRRDATGSEERPSKVRRLMSLSDSIRRRDAKTAVYWPRDLVPEVLPHARVMTYGYDTHIRHQFVGPALNKNQVYDIAWDFLQEATAQRQHCLTRPVLFVAHSLGGIVVKETLRRSSGCYMGHSHLRGIFDSTVGIMFFGTPHRGSEPRGLIKSTIESLGKILLFRLNQQIVDTLLPTSERLRELRDEFGPLAHRQGWKIHSFQEQLGVAVLNGDKVVEDSSSSMDLPAIETTQHINRDHMEMCRFTGPDDTEFKKIASALVRMADGLRPSDQGSQKETTGSLTKSERKLLLDSLGFDRMEARRLAIKKSHPRTCEWLLEQQEYMDWTAVSKLGEHHGFLWIRGHAGTGKSTLMKFALAREREKKDKIIISFFFNARGQELERSMLGMYRSLLRQLLAKAPRLQRALDVLSLTMVAKDGHEWSIESLKSVLEQAVLGLGKTSLVCYIDALDECDESDISDMLSFFETVGRDVTANGGINLRVCISSRHFPAFDISTGLKFDLEGQRGHKQDIVNYVDRKLKLTDYDQAEQLRTEVKTKAKGVFMWAALVVDLLNKEYNRGRLFSLQEKLTQIPTGLHSLFHEIMTKDSQDNEDLLLCVQWMLFSQRPLRPEALYHAIIASGRLKAGAEPQPVARGSFVPTIEVIRRLIVDTSKGLVEVTSLVPPTVQFIHESVRDYLLKEDGLVQLWPSLGEGPGPRGQCHERLKACCLAIMDAYASDGDIHDPLPPEASPTEYHKRRQAICESSPLLQYAASSLLYHADRAEGCGVSQNTFLEMLGVGLGRFIDLTNIFEQHEVRRHTREVPLLYLLAEANCPNLCRIHPDRQDYLLMTTERHYCALFAARAIGNDAVVSTFLHAAWRGQTALAKLLIELGDVDTDARDADGMTALAWAAKHAHVDVVSFLLGTGRVDADARDADRRTPLWWAARAGHVSAARLLHREGNAQLDARDVHGWTPLSWAAEFGRLGVMRYLVESGEVEVDGRDHDGWTPLTWAASKGRLDVVRYLVATGKVDVEARDKNQMTPLQIAARDNRLPVVEFLIREAGADAGATDYQGRNALCCVVERAEAESGIKGIVLALLATGKCDPRVVDERGHSALSLAQERLEEDHGKWPEVLRSLESFVQGA